MGGVIIAGAATTPIWVPVATGFAVGSATLAMGIAVWDILDAPEDNALIVTAGDIAHVPPPRPLINIAQNP